MHAAGAMRTLAVATLLLAGCLPQGDDASCHDASATGGICGPGSVDPTGYVGYLSPSVLAMPDGSARVAATRVDSEAETRVELATLRADGKVVRNHLVGLDEPILPHLAGIPGGAILLEWQERDSQQSFVGPLVLGDNDGGQADRDAVDPTATTILPPARPIGLYRVGDRILAAGQPVDGVTAGQFLRGSDGAPLGPLALAGDPADIWLAATDDSTGQAGVWAQLVAHPVPSAGFDLRVSRIAADGTVIDAGRKVARTDTPAGAIAIATDGGAIVAYHAVDGTTHVVRLGRANQLADQRVAMRMPDVLVPHGAGFLAVGVDTEEVVRAYGIDGRGNITSGPTFFPSGSVFTFSAAAAATDGFTIAANTLDDQIVLAKFDAIGAVTQGPLCIACR